MRRLLAPLFFLSLFACRAPSNLAATSAAPTQGEKPVAYETAFEIGNGHPVPTSGVGFFRGEMVPFFEVDGDAVSGDVILGRVADISGSDVTLPASSAVYRWPGGLVPFEIAPGFPNPARVTQALSHWNTKLAGTLSLIPHTSEADYILFKRAPGDGICSSYIGRMGMGAQAIRLGSLCATGNVIHEIGHAIGLYHEHSRRDRDGFVKVHKENVLKGFEDNFILEPVGVLDTGIYDFGSIMHYGPDVYSANGLPTLETIPPGRAIGQRAGLSARDIASAKELYPSSTFGPPPSNTLQVSLGTPPINLADGVHANGTIENANLPLVGASDGTGALYVAGTKLLSNAPGKSAFLSKFSSTGALLWQKERPGSTTTASSIGVDRQGGVYVAGLLGPDPSGKPCFLAKFDPAGNQVWLRPYGNAIEEAPQGLFTDPDGATTVVSGSFESRGLITRFNPDGTLRSSFAFPGINGQQLRLYSVVVDPVGNLYVGGATKFGEVAGISIPPGPFYSKLSPTGSLIWRSHVPSESDPGEVWDRTRGSMVLDPMGNLYATGTFLNFDKDAPAWRYGLYLVKLDANGELKWRTNYYDALELEVPTDRIQAMPFGVVRDPVSGQLFVSSTHEINVNFTLVTNPELLGLDDSGKVLWRQSNRNSGVLYPSNPVLSQGSLFQFGVTSAAFFGMPAPTYSNWAVYLSRYTLTGVPH